MINFLAVQEERGPRKHKNVLTPKRLSSAFISISQNVSFKSSPTLTTPQHELAAQILLLAIKQVRCNSGFGSLSRTAQNNVLANVWSALFILKAAYWPYDAITAVPNAEKAFQHLRDLRMDPYDLEIVENILLCRSDLISDANQASLAENKQDYHLEKLTVSLFFTYCQFFFWKKKFVADSVFVGSEEVQENPAGDSNVVHAYGYAAS